MYTLVITTYLVVKPARLDTYIYMYVYVVTTYLVVKPAVHHVVGVTTSAEVDGANDGTEVELVTLDLWHVCISLARLQHVFMLRIQDRCHADRELTSVAVAIYGLGLFLCYDANIKKLYHDADI